jgi:nucleotide-binding universal stress UspA family protein
VTPAQTTASHYLMDVAHYGLYESDASAASVEHLARTEWVRPLVTARVPWGVDVRYGWAADVLARCAEDIGAQLIIIGAGSHATQNGTEGSVVAVLSHRTPVPLLVVPDESPSIELRAAEHSAAAS